MGKRRDIASMSLEELEQYETELNERLEYAKRREEEYPGGRYPTSHYLASCDIAEIEGALRAVRRMEHKGTIH